MVGGEWHTKFSVIPGPGLWSLVLGPFGPDLGPDLDLTWDLDLDLSLTIIDPRSSFRLNLADLQNDEEAIETLGYPLLGPSLIFILTVCSFNFANNLETLLALLLPLYCSEH